MKTKKFAKEMNRFFAVTNVGLKTLNKQNKKIKNKL